MFRCSTKKVYNSIKVTSQTKQQWSMGFVTACCRFHLHTPPAVHRVLTKIEATDLVLNLRKVKTGKQCIAMLSSHTFGSKLWMLWLEWLEELRVAIRRCQTIYCLSYLGWVHLFSKGNATSTPPNCQTKSPIFLTGHPWPWFQSDSMRFGMDCCIFSDSIVL